MFLLFTPSLTRCNGFASREEVLIFAGRVDTKRYRVTATARIQGQYKSPYSNLGSSESQAFIKNFTERVGRFLKEKLQGYRGIEVTRLLNGSVVVNFIILTERNSDANVKTIELALMEGNSTGKLGVVLVGNIILEEIVDASNANSPTTSPKDKGNDFMMHVTKV